MSNQTECGTHIQFVPGKPNPKTFTWFVFTKDDLSIGYITWWGSWRCYAFHPVQGTVFEKVCLREIADFCEKKTKEHKQGARP